MNPERITIEQFIEAIRQLPSDKPVDGGVWYRTQKEHWLGWLSGYNTVAEYGRQIGMNRSAQYAYNHIVNPQMLRWLIAAAGVTPELVRAARRASSRADTFAGQSGAIRKLVPWSEVVAALW